MYKYALFDLDGTLTDPKEGICKSVQYALHKMGIEEDNLDKLEPFIGPPLLDSFKQFYNMSPEQARQAQDFYRERFSVVGKYENVVYPGIPEMLGKLKAEGVKLAVASSKPQIFVDDIMQHFELAEYFDVIVGSDIDGAKKTKTDVVRAALIGLYGGEISDEYKSQTIMVGDRCFDIEGAHNLGIKGMGVTYGYAAKGELKNAGADMIAKSVEGVGKLIIGISHKTGNKDNTRNNSSAVIDKKADNVRKSAWDEQNYIKPVPEKSFLRAVYVVAPFAFYYIVLMATMTICLAVVEQNNIASVTDNSWFVSGTVNAISSFVAGILMIMVFHKTDPLPVRTHFSLPYVFLAGALLSMGFNLLFGFICQIFPALNQYTGSSPALYDSPLIVRIVCYIIVSPFVEELVFRYMLYGRMRRFLEKGTAIVFSAIFFGLYHGQILQGIYAFIMGIFIAVIYEWTGSFIAPLLFHMASNAVVIFAPYIPENIQKIFSSLPMMLVYIGVGIYIYIFIFKKIKAPDNRKQGKA